MGNLGGVVCMTAAQEDEHGLTPIKGARSGISDFYESDDHSWMRCLLCTTVMLSDPMSWGSLAYCIGCWNHFTERGLYPPGTASQARRMSADDWGG